MGYAQVDVIVEGALSESFIRTSPFLAQAFLDRCQRDAIKYGVTIEVYVQWHGHSASVDECSCAQYETDHHPAHTFTPASDAASDATERG